MQDSIQSGITEAGKFLSRYENILEEKETSEVAKQLILRQRFQEYLDEESINVNCITGGVSGIWLSVSDADEKEVIEITAIYQIQFPIPFFGEKSSLIEQTVKTRAFVGKKMKKEQKEVGDSEKNSEEDDYLVYIAENGSVYHRSETCSHLKLAISETDEKGLETKRNDSGAKYKACEKCINSKVNGERLYIAKEGDRYHISLSCSGLKRTVYTVYYSKVKEMRKCSRCG